MQKTFNSAIRVSEILKTLKQHNNVSIYNAWQNTLKVNSLIEVAAGISKIDNQLEIIQQELDNSGRKNNALENAIVQIRTFLGVSNLDANISLYFNSGLSDMYIAVIETSDLIFSTDGIYSENIIDDNELEEMKQKLDELINDFTNSIIDVKTKKILIRILNEISLSLKFYKIDGVSEIEASLVSLICATKTVDNDKNFTEQLKSGVKDFIVFVGGCVLSSYINQDNISFIASTVQTYLQDAIKLIPEKL